MGGSQIPSGGSSKGDAADGVARIFGALDAGEDVATFGTLDPVTGGVVAVARAGGCTARTVLIADCRAVLPWTVVAADADGIVAAAGGAEGIAVSSSGGAVAAETVG
jgi:hypothetical protein